MIQESDDRREQERRDEVLPQRGKVDFARRGDDPRAHQGTRQSMEELADTSR